MKKIKKIIIFLCFLLIAVLGIKFYKKYFSIPYDGPRILFEANFESGNSLTDMGFKYSGNKTARIVKIGGRSAVRTSLKRFEDEFSYRSEIELNALPRPNFKKHKIHGEQHSTAIIGKEYRYSIMTFLPEDWQFESYSKIIMQWHGCPDWNRGEKWRNPPISLKIFESESGEGSNYHLRITTDSNQVTGPRGPYEVNENIDLGSIVGDLGKWTYWEFQIKWSYQNDGSIIVWKDGEIVLQRKAQANTYNDKYGPFWKFGVYIPHWKKNSKQLPGVEHYTAYFDNVRIVAIK